MPKVEIAINGRAYSVACDPGQEARVRELAAMVDSRVRRLSPQGSGAPTGEAQLLVMTGLMLADELSEAQAAASASTAAEDEELLVAAVDHLTERVDDIAARLDRT